MSGPQHQSVRLGRSRRLALSSIAVGVWLSGGLWLLFHYFFVEQGDFGLKTHPLEPWWLKLHGAFAFASIWMFGLLWGVHVTAAWPFSRRRWSGSVMTGILLLLTVSGYLLYYEGNETARSLTSTLHWGIGVVCPIVFFWHRFRQRKARRRVKSNRVKSRSHEEFPQKDAHIYMK